MVIRGVVIVTVVLCCAHVDIPEDPGRARLGEPDSQGERVAVSAQRSCQEASPEDHPEG